MNELNPRVKTIFELKKKKEIEKAASCDGVKAVVVLWTKAAILI